MGAWEICKVFLRDIDPNHAGALLLAGSLHWQAREYAEAYAFAKRAVDVGPQYSGAWLNLGCISEAIYRFEEADHCYRKALRKSENDGKRMLVLNNWAAMLIQKGDWTGGEELARQALQIDPLHKKARANLGTALLAKGQWKEGWPLYDEIIGHGDQRKQNQYSGEPVWDGSPGKTVVIYGEQGMGDEISFASMLPDAIRDCKRVIVDCDERLAGLFRRSFPAATVYGTRWKKELHWRKEDQQIDASISIGALGKFYRPTPESCPGTPWLLPDPDRLAMWKGLWATKQKPVIGIAWTGGLHWTGAKFRNWTLDKLLPVFRAVDAHWVCLQYKDAEREIAEFVDKHGVDLKQYKWGTLTNDYDDTAALVASLDHVVCMQTAVVHLSGALGIPCHAFVHKHGQWRYGVNGDRIPWYGSVRLFRQKQNGYWPIDEAASALNAHFGTVQAAAD